MLQAYPSASSCYRFCIPRARYRWSTRRLNAGQSNAFCATSSFTGAAKLVADRGLSNVTLVQASAHELPFRDRVLDYVQAINVIEHVFRPEHFFKEIRRVLAPDGIFCGDSRNRFDAFFPEPHVKLMWVGFLPRQLMDRYVRLRTGFGYGRKYLLSYFELSRALTRSFGSAYRSPCPTSDPTRRRRRPC